MKRMMSVGMIAMLLAGPWSMGCAKRDNPSVAQATTRAEEAARRAEAAASRTEAAAQRAEAAADRAERIFSKSYR